MQTLDMTFFEEFKRLENICNDKFSCKSGVTEYITQMEQAAEKGRVAVSSWDGDYKTLKHLRWLRNQIAHSADEGLFCKQEDLTQLRKFHKRILSQEDPLALLTKAAKPKAKAPAKPKQTQSTAPRSAADTSGKPKTAAKKESGNKPEPKKKKQSRAGAVILLIIVLLLFVAGLGILYLDVSGIVPLSELGNTIRHLPEIIGG